MVKKKEQKILNPKIEEIGKSDFDYSEIAQQIKDSRLITKEEDNSSDSFFREVVNKLFDKKDISLKTEYKNENEQFSVSKLKFMSDFCNMGYIDRFLDIWKQDRVSLERKSRKEIVLSLEKREEELRNRENAKLKSMFGM